MLSGDKYFKEEKKAEEEEDREYWGQEVAV